MAGATYKKLETEFAQYVKSKHAVACNSGTSALHLALLSCGIKEGDEVIVPDFTMAACGFAVEYTGAKPVFVDCDDTLNIDVNKIEEKITPKTKAIMAVHIYGRLCNMDKIVSIAKEYGLYVIEDAAEAHGAVFNSKAHITCFSLYANKIIHAEEGGICTTNYDIHKERMEYYKNMAFDQNHTFFHHHIGFNYRMAESQAKLAIKSLRNVNKELKRRRKIESNLIKKYGETMPSRDVVWMFDSKIKLEGDTRPFFKPLSSMPMWGGKCTSPKALYYSQFNYLKI